MNFWKFLILSGIVVCLQLSCSKPQGPEPPPPPPPPPNGVNINISYPLPGAAAGINYELIITEPGGKKLLDTIVGVNVSVAARLITDSKLVDLTTILYDPSSDTYKAITYKSIDPGYLKSSVGLNYSLMPQAKPTTPANIYYAHPPANALNSPFQPPFLFNDAAKTSGLTSTFTNASLSINYPRQNGNYAYLLFPHLGLYNLSLPKSDRDTVDLSEMDTVTKIKFNIPAAYNLSSCSLLGVFDTTDLSKSVSLYDEVTRAADADLEVPKIPVQKFQLTVNANYNYGMDWLSFYSYSDTIPTEPIFIDGLSYNLTSTANDHFAVEFLDFKPSYYMTQWNSGKLRWQLFSSPDSIVGSPVTLFQSFNSKLLEGRSVADFKLGTFLFEVVDQMNYKTYMRYSLDPAQVAAKHVSQAVQYYRIF